MLVAWQPLIGLGRRRVVRPDVCSSDVIVWIYDWIRTGRRIIPQHQDRGDANRMLYHTVPYCPSPGSSTKENDMDFQLDEARYCCVTAGFDSVYRGVICH